MNKETIIEDITDIAINDDTLFKNDPDIIF